MLKIIVKKKAALLIFCIVFAIFLFAISLRIPEQEETQYVRSSSLQLISTANGDIERYDYVNDKGIVTFAADKHYATVIRTRQDNSVLEEFYDAEGKPAKQKIGHYAVKREYDDAGRNYKITYIDENGNITKTKTGYAIVTRTYSDDGCEETELYFDENEKRIRTYSLCSGCKRLYDENGWNTDVIYIDENDVISKNGLGYAMIHKTYYTEGDTKGKLKDEFYFDEFYNPVNLSNGQYGVHREYDELGREYLTTFLDSDGNSIISVDGYTTSKRVYYDDDSIRSEQYYDQDGNPIALSEGQYGVYYKDGNKAYLDINGNIKFNLKNHLYRSSWLVVVIGILIAVISMLSNKSINISLFCAYIAFVIYMTLLFRSSSTAKYDFRPFWSYRQFFSNAEIRGEILQNIALFLPLGYILYGITKDIKWVLLLVGISLVIEIMQLCAKIGFSELDDIISNSFGGYLGYTLGKLTTALKQRINSWKHIHNA